MYLIILYYKYIYIENPEAITALQRELCIRLDLTGRIIIAHEGINGTLEGTADNIEKYIKETKKIKEFSDINFKKSEGQGRSFPKLSVKLRKEIVTLGRPNIFPIPSETGADYMNAEDLHMLLEKKKDEVVVLDMRNEYELKVGKFDSSIALPVQNFREIPAHARELEKYKNKTVVAVCTGGVRCEKGTAYLKQELGFEHIYQLHDGIVTYMTKYPRGHFKGALYVFDGRVTMRTDGMPVEVIGKCELCGSASEKFVNCSLAKCHKHFIVCLTCLEKSGGEKKIVCDKEH